MYWNNSILINSNCSSEFLTWLYNILCLFWVISQLNIVGIHLHSCEHPLDFYSATCTSNYYHAIACVNSYMKIQFCMFVFIMFMNFPRTAQYNFLSIQIKECRKICLTFTKSNIYTSKIIYCISTHKILIFEL